MKIGILGSGDVAKALGNGFLERGYGVMLGTRDASKLAAWQQEHAGASIGSFADAAAFGELVVLAVAAEAVPDVVALAKREHFAGKVVVDTTNPIAFDERGPHLTTQGESMGERVQAQLPEARVVKAFNTVGFALMVDPQLRGGPPTMFVAGNDDDAKATVGKILTAFGWETADLGGIAASRALEAMCLAWLLYAVRNQGRAHAFKLLR